MAERRRPKLDVETEAKKSGGSSKTCDDGSSTEDASFSPKTPGGSSLSGRIWQKVKEKYELVDFNALPEFLRDNEYILDHYRSNWPLRQTLQSLFTIHNETLNIWTHLVGFLLFLGLTIYTIIMIPKVEMPSMPRLPSMEDLHRLQNDLMTCFPSLPSLSDLHLPQLPEMLANCLPESLLASNRTDQCVLQTMRDDVANMVAPLLLKPITRWPFFIFLGGAMFCLFASAVCHLFSCHSEPVKYFLMRMDYVGIASLIAASFYPPVYYAFMCNPLWRNMYLISITCVGVATICVSLLPIFQSPKYRSFRASLFFCMGVSGIIPMLHKFFMHWDEPVAVNTLLLEVAMGAFYGFGALVYATRIPERWKPGLFDIAGNSHQLFHVLVVAGAYTHYKAGLLYLQWRDSERCPT